VRQEEIKKGFLGWLRRRICFVLFACEKRSSLSGSELLLIGGMSLFFWPRNKGQHLAGLIEMTLILLSFHKPNHWPIHWKHQLCFTSITEPHSLLLQHALYGTYSILLVKKVPLLNSSIVLVLYFAAYSCC